MTTPFSEATARQSAAKWRSERGASPVSMLIIVMLVMMLLDLTVVASRIAWTHNELQLAVREAARQGTLAKNANSAFSAAAAVAADNLKGRNCTNQSEEIDVDGFLNGDLITVSASCEVPLTDLSVLRLPLPNITINVAAEEIIDNYRAVE